MKVVSMFNGESKVKLVSENEFTKHHRYEEKDVDCYLSKAYDEETEKHFLVASIPRIPELNAMHIQYPMVFETEAERNKFFDEFNALDFLDYLIDQMSYQIEQAKKEAAYNEKSDKDEADIIVGGADYLNLEKANEQIRQEVEAKLKEIGENPEK